MLSIIFLGSLIIWYMNQDNFPNTIRIGTASENGFYHDFGKSLAESLSEQEDIKVNLITTQGSVENYQLLLENQLELAIIQAGTVSFKNVKIIAPLFFEVLHIVVRKKSNINTIEDLKNKTVYIGSQGSGIRQNALDILTHYQLLDQITIAQPDNFLDLLEDESIDAAFITSWLLNNSIETLLKNNEFNIISIPNPEIFEIKHGIYKRFEIPKNFYNNQTPDQNITTVSTLSYLVAPKYSSELFIQKILLALYSNNVGLKHFNLIQRHQVLQLKTLPLSTYAIHFFQPTDNLQKITNFVVSVDTIKELLIALVAGSLLLMNYINNLKEKQKSKVLIHQKESIDILFKHILRIEKAQLNIFNREKLEKYLEEITQIKTQALKEFTDEAIRNDSDFTLFISQCDSLIHRIHIKILGIKTL